MRVAELYLVLCQKRKKSNVQLKYLQGFHKTLPDKWEFANEYFKRGRRELLIQIHRRKTKTPAKEKSDPNIDSGSASPPSGSGHDHGSSSTSSPESKNPSSIVQPTPETLENLSDENEKLKKEKIVLTTELAHAKKQCDDLVAFLSRCVNMSPDEIGRVIGGDVVVGEMAMVGHEVAADVDNDHDDVDKDGDCFRLFGVLLKDGKKKRGFVEKNLTLGSQMKKMKVQMTNG